MSVVGWICAAGTVLLMWITVETLKAFILTETATRLERLPNAILRLARRRLPPEQREAIHDEEWLPELIMIVRETDGLPITRMLRGVDYAISLLFAARSIAREIDSRETWVPLILSYRELFPGKAVIWESDVRSMLDSSVASLATATDPDVRADLDRRVATLQIFLDEFASLPE